MIVSSCREGPTPSLAFTEVARLLKFFYRSPFPRLLSVYTVYMAMHSWITISLNDPRPLYLQVIDQIKLRVAVGDLPPGTELPSIRQLAADLRISVITIKRAYLELEREGMILTRHGKGSVIAEQAMFQTAVQEAELNERLEGAASLGLLLGLSKTELQRRLADAYERIKRGAE